ncbi:hypothetical protein SASPL_120794 [Salvia splendens]|uniref:Uncharacterized protein n=1 Tax=Salvia splendens TaxID=180675 RepID=A0A8X8XQB1_SALSN|nr:hypothetical protein SASPL_120794 [Salvia splendens]
MQEGCCLYKLIEDLYKNLYLKPNSSNVGTSNCFSLLLIFFPKYEHEWTMLVKGELYTELVKKMLFEPDVDMWLCGALFGACGLHSCLEVGEFAAMRISKVKKDNLAVYSHVSKIYGANGTRSGVFQLKKMIREGQGKKQKTGSWIQSK